MKNGIRLSDKHGVNPSISVCFYCNKDKNEIVLPGKLKWDVQAPMRGVWSMEPCGTCKDHMDKGVLLISVDEAKSTDPQNPWRTGGWVVIKDEAVRRMVKPDVLADSICKRRMAFVPDAAWDMLGLPR
jgi:hypothetical protein